MVVYVLRPHKVECPDCLGEDRFKSRHYVRKDVLILAPLSGSEASSPPEVTDSFDLPDYDPIKNA
jgi:hypothetical protein